MFDSTATAVDNPFRAPTQISPDQTSLAPGEDFRVLDDSIVCRGDVYLPQICGVTGNTENLVSTRTIKKSVTPRWVGMLLALTASVVALAMIVGTDPDTFGALVAVTVLFVLPFIMFVIGGLTTKKLLVTVGLSAEGKRQLIRNGAARILTWLLCICTSMAGAYLIGELQAGEKFFLAEEFGMFESHLSHSTEKDIILITCGAVASWLIASLFIRFLLRPLPFRPRARLLPSGLFVVAGFPKDFLLRLRRADGSHAFPSMN